MNLGLLGYTKALQGDVWKGQEQHLCENSYQEPDLFATWRSLILICRDNFTN